MPRKRMSLRAIAAMKRENRELRAKLSVSTRVDDRRSLTSWTGIGERVRDEVRTARRLGFIVEAETVNDSLSFTAVKRVSANA